MLKAIALPLTAARLIEIGVLAYLLVPILFPLEDVARGFFFALVMPAVIWSLVRRKFSFSQYRDFFVPFFALVAYLAVSALCLSDADLPQQVRRVRWLLEIVVWVIALFIVVPEWRRHSALYGRLLIIAAGVAALAAVIGCGLTTGFSDRLSWVGYLRQPIQGPSLLICYWLMGVILLGSDRDLSGRASALCYVSYLAIVVMAVLTASRGPLLSALLALPLLLLTQISARKLVFARVALGIAGGIAFVALCLSMDSVQEALASMRSRDTLSIRWLMWRAVFEMPPPSILWGWGIATDFVDTSVGKHLYQLFQDNLSHVHNSLLNIYFFSGLAGLALMGWLLAPVLRAGFVAVRGSGLLFARFAVFLAVMLTLHAVEAYRIVSAPNPDWSMIWLVLVFIRIGFARHGDTADASAGASSTAWKLRQQESVR